jgi:hypothetical protein
MAIKRKNKFYSLNMILKTNSIYNVIFGERSNGKTYSVLKYGVEQYFKTGGEIAIVRRLQEDIRGKRASGIFTALIENGEIEKISNGQFTGVHYYAGRFYLCTYTELGKVLYNDKDVIGHVFALSNTEHDKSISFPKITTILFDEFLTRKTYLPDEFISFMNTISTIVRQRNNVKIFMLGNTVNKYSPYFNEMGLKHIQKMEQGSIDVYNYGKSKLTVAVEYCAPNTKNKDSNFYFAFDNPKLNMITKGTWELSIYPHLPIKYKPKDVLLEYFIVFDDNIFQCNIIDLEGELFTYIHSKTTDIKDLDNDIIYSIEYSHKFNYNRSIYKPTHEIGKKILYFFLHDKVFYQDNNVGDTVNNYLEIAKNL